MFHVNGRDHTISIDEDNAIRRLVEAHHDGKIGEGLMSKILGIDIIDVRMLRYDVFGLVVPDCDHCMDKGGVSSCNRCGLISVILAPHFRMRAKKYRESGAGDRALKCESIAKRLTDGERVYEREEGI